MSKAAHQLIPDIGARSANPTSTLTPHYPTPSFLTLYTPSTPKTASENDHTKSKKVLLEHGADVERAMKDGRTPLLIGTHPTSQDHSR